MLENEMSETPEPVDGVGMSLHPMMQFYKWGAENKPIRQRGGEGSLNIDGDVDVNMKLRWPNVNNKNIAMSNLNNKDERVAILRQMTDKMIERALTKKRDMTTDRLIAEERNESDYRVRLTMGRLGFFMRQMTTSTNIIMNNTQPQPQQQEQPRPRWV